MPIKSEQLNNQNIASLNQNNEKLMEKSQEILNKNNEDENETTVIQSNDFVQTMPSKSMSINDHKSEMAQIIVQNKNTDDETKVENNKAIENKESSDKVEKKAIKKKDKTSKNINDMAVEFNEKEEVRKLKHKNTKLKKTNKKLKKQIKELKSKLKEEIKL